MTSKEKNSSTPKLRSYTTYGPRDIGDSISLKLPDSIPKKVAIKNKSLREIKASVMKEEKIGNKREQSAANPPKEFRTSIGFDKISYSEDEDSVMIGIQDDERKKKMALIMNIMMQKNNKEDVNA